MIFSVANALRSFHALVALVFGTINVAAMEWKPRPDKITVLAVAAHPDDEGIFFGGALPYYAGVLQVPTMLVSMTSGDWITNNLLIRENELRNAAWIYGLRYEPVFGRFRDVPSHNMTANPYPSKIDATWDYWADGILQGDGKDVAAGREKAINFVAEIIRRHRPDVIITHDFNGEYGHDNHKATAMVVAEAYYVAADSSATATNLVALAPWQARKLYVHLYNTNRLFHTEWEFARDEFAGKTCRDVANDGLDAHISQNRPDVSTFYLSNENFNGYDSERWGLFASTVGLDTPVTNDVAYGNFFENLDFSHPTNRAPEFFPQPVRVTAAQMDQAYSGQTLARFATDPDKVAGDTLTFSKLSGPAWLNISTNGLLSGTPGALDVGENLFLVRVTDSSSAFDDAELRVFVRGRLAASWNCNETDGLVAKDTSGENHHAILTHSNMWSAGRDGGALKFIGTNEFATSDNLNVGNELTVAAWLYSTNLTGERAVVGEHSGYTLKTSGTSLRFTTPGIRDHTFAVNLTTGQWYHLAVTFQAGVTNGCKFFVNGQFRGATNASAKNATTNLTWIGRNQFGQYFAGMLDDIRIYRVVLDATEIASLHANRTPTFSTNLISCPSAIETFAYTNDLLEANASDADAEPLTFRKSGGPPWLNVSSNGNLSGTPVRSDVGTNSFSVQAIDTNYAVAETILQIVVAYQPTFLLEASLENNRARLNFVGNASQTYQLLISSNLLTWSPAGQLETDRLGSATWLDSIGRSNAYFFRVAQ